MTRNRNNLCMFVDTGYHFIIVPVNMPERAGIVFIHWRISIKIVNFPHSKLLFNNNIREETFGVNLDISNLNVPGSSGMSMGLGTCVSVRNEAQLVVYACHVP